MMKATSLRLLYPVLLVMFTCTAIATAAPKKGGAAAAGASGADIGTIPIAGRDNPRLASLDEMVLDAMAKHKLHGATLAISKAGRSSCIARATSATQ